MHAQSVCNLIATLSSHPWTTPLDLSLEITNYGEERISFYNYVQTELVQPSCASSSQSSSFTLFNRLPAELQLRILSFCSGPTLFQIMRTSVLRTEAEKLFWALESTYYHIEASWLFGGAYPGRTWYDMSFMTFVQNVEIEYGPLCDRNIGGIKDNVSFEIDYENVRRFWKTFQARFPRAKRVVLNKNWESWSTHRRDDQPVGCCLKVLVEECPTDIDVLAFVLVEGGSGGSKRTVPLVANYWHRVLYRLTDEGDWEKVRESGFKRNTVLMPPKRFHGPVGEFEEFKYDSMRLEMQGYGLRALAIEALDRHHFNKEDPEQFFCKFGCEVLFTKAGQWIRHASETHSNEFITDSRFDILPKPLQDMFDEHFHNLEQRAKDTQRKLGKMYDDWNEDEGKNREEIKRGWIHQLDNHEAWNVGKKGIDRKLWKEYTTMLDPTWLDPTWIGR